MQISKSNHDAAKLQIIKLNLELIIGLVNAIVIDDDIDTVDVFVDYLRILNVDVGGVGYDGKAAVELFDLHRPDLVFLDLMMPEYDGFYALERIRKIDATAKVIVVTADLRNDTEEALRRLSPTEIVYKPYNPEQLKTIIERLTNNRSSNRPI